MTSNTVRPELIW